MAHDKEDSPQTFTTAEAAQRLGISIAKLYQFITAGRIKPKVHRNEVTLNAADVDALFDELAANRDTYVGALEALHRKVCTGLPEPLGHTEDAKLEVGMLVNDLFRRMARDAWDSLALRIDREGQRAELIYNIGGETHLLEKLEVKLGQEVAASLCEAASLNTEATAARSAFTFSADGVQTRFHAAHAVAVDSERVHIIRFEQDHPEFERIWKLPEAQRAKLEEMLATPGGLYLMSTPRDLPGAFHVLSLARRLCPEQRAGVLISKHETLRREGFLTEIVYGDGEEQPSLDEALKTVFALDASVAVFTDVSSVEQARAVLEMSAAGVPTVAFLPGSSLAESIGAWRGWGIGAAALAREVRIGIERRGSSHGLSYRLLCDTKQLPAALSAENAIDAVEALME